MLWTVPKDWTGQSCFVIAGGPSLRSLGATLADVASRLTDGLRGRARVITVNDSWRLAPWADALYFCDPSWWQQQDASNLRSIDGVHSFAEMAYNAFWVTGSRTFLRHPQVRSLEMTGQLGFEEDPRGLRHGSNSGYQAIHLAAHYGVARIALLGFDMNVGDYDRTHWHDEQRPDGFAGILKNAMLPCFPSLAEALAKRGVEVVNANPNSALKVWPRRDLQGLLCDPAWSRGSSTTTGAAEVPPEHPLPLTL